MLSWPMRETHSANKILKTRLATQHVESSIRHETPRQPRAPVFVCSLKAIERSIDLAEPGENGRDEHLRYVLPRAYLLQFVQDVPCFFLLSPHGEGPTQRRYHQRVVAGKLAGFLQCDGSFGELAGQLVRQTQIKISRKKVRIHLHRRGPVVDRFAVLARKVMRH